MSLQIGQIVNNRYQIIALLGQGGMGAVYQARDLRLGQIVALKENSGGDPRQFQQEATLLAKLRHPNLPRVMDHFIELNGAQYLVMDFIAGDDLETHLQRQGALPQAQALTWLNQILDAVAYLHTQGVIHRDIKPANIKITPEGQAVLVDFGIAKVYQPGQATQTGARAATPGYAAPEQYRGGTDQRSDVYSLGATLYALLVGGDPPDALALEKGIATLTPPSRLNLSVSAQTEQAILRAMAPQSQNRFQSAVELRQALVAVASPPRPILLQPTAPISVPTTLPAGMLTAARQPARTGAPGLPWLKIVLTLVVSLFVVCGITTGLSMIVWNALQVQVPTTGPPTRAISGVSPPTSVAPPATSFARFECKDKLGCIDIGPNEPIHIAYMFVVSGPDSMLGLDTKYGAELAVDDRGGKLLGHPIKFDGQDSGCSPEGGQSAATRIIADRTIVAVIGTNCSSEAVPGAPIISNGGLTMISPSNTAPHLTDPATRVAGYFRTAHNDKVQGAAAAQFVKDRLKFTNVATIHDGGPYTEALADIFADNFRQLGGTATVEAVNVGDKDMKPVLNRLAAKKPELIYFPLFVAEGGFICAQMRDVAGLEKTVMMGADGIFSPDFLKACGKNSAGMYFSSPDFSAFGGGYKDFVAKYLKKYNVKGPLAPFHAHAYDAANIFFAAIEKATAKDADGTLHVQKQALRDTVAATRDFKGLTGNLTCDPNGDCADPKIAVYQVTAENFVRFTMPVNPIWQTPK